MAARLATLGRTEYIRTAVQPYILSVAGHGSPDTLGTGALGPASHTERMPLFPEDASSRPSRPWHYPIKLESVVKASRKPNSPNSEQPRRIRYTPSRSCSLTSLTEPSGGSRGGKSALVLSPDADSARRHGKPASAAAPHARLPRHHAASKLKK